MEVQHSSSPSAAFLINVYGRESTVTHERYNGGIVCHDFNVSLIDLVDLPTS